MHIAPKQLNPLHSIQLTPDEEKIVSWFRKAVWEAQPTTREPIPYKTKVPEFFGGVRLYHMQAGGGASAQSPLERFIKKLEYQGVITKQDLYPLTIVAGARFLCLKKVDLDNLGVGQESEEEE
jgi:hypothetical protein